MRLKAKKFKSDKARAFGGARIMLKDLYGDSNRSNIKYKNEQPLMAPPLVH